MFLIKSLKDMMLMSIMLTIMMLKMMLDSDNFENILIMSDVLL